MLGIENVEIRNGSIDMNVADKPKILKFIIAVQALIIIGLVISNIISFHSRRFFEERFWLEYNINLAQDCVGFPTDSLSVFFGTPTDTFENIIIVKPELGFKSILQTRYHGYEAVIENDTVTKIYLYDGERH